MERMIAEDHAYQEAVASVGGDRSKIPSVLTLSVTETYCSMTPAQKIASANRLLLEMQDKIESLQGRYTWMRSELEKFEQQTAKKRK
jgi:hypothetical protein